MRIDYSDEDLDDYKKITFDEYVGSQQVDEPMLPGNVVFLYSFLVF
jgi:hypothetical protein